MITDDERRETVGNLRRLSHMNRVRYKEEFCELLDEAVMGPDVGYHEMNDVFERIADLIDRGGCGNACDGNETGACGDGFECPACGCRVGDGGRYRVGGTWNFCPQCGREAADHAH